MGQAGRMPSLPGPVRAAVGLVAVVADEARTLPDRAIELPMLRGQHRAAALAARTAALRAARRPGRRHPQRQRHASDEPPPWATFDDPITADSAAPETPDASNAEFVDSADEGADATGDVTDLDVDIEPGPGKTVERPT